MITVISYNTAAHLLHRYIAMNHRILDRILYKFQLMDNGNLLHMDMEMYLHIKKITCQNVNV